MRLLAVAAAAAALASPSASAAQFVASHRQADGSFAEPGGRPSVGLTAWATLGLVSAGEPPGEDTLRYLVATEERLESVTDVELVLLAQAALGRRSQALLDRLRAAIHPSGRIGPAVNSTIWGILALRTLGEPVPPATVRYLLRQQRPSGGFAWAEGVAPDSNDTAAAVQALRAVSAGGASVRRALLYLRRLQARDGGFRLAPGRDPDAQSTAWAIQAFLAAGERPPRGAYAFLRRLRRPDGSYRYSSRYATTPVWVTAQVLPALYGKPFPLAPSPGGTGPRRSAITSSALVAREEATRPRSSTLTAAGARRWASVSATSSLSSKTTGEEKRSTASAALP